MRIAFFDSGIGGLTVLGQALAALPNEEYLYLADSLHAPYGVRSKSDVRDLTFDAVACLARQELHALVVACNTATSAAIADLRSRYAFPIIGMEPAVKPALAHSSGKKILVVATSLTLRENKLESLIVKLDSAHRVERLALDRLVTFAERFDFGSASVRDYLGERFAHIDWPAYESLVLGCTHFVYYRPLLGALAGDGVQLLDGNAGTVNRLVSLVGAGRSSEPPREPRVRFLASGGADEPPERAERLRALLGPLP